MITGVLIAQDADHPATAQKPDRFLETFAPVKKLHPEASPLLPDELVEMTVTEFLIDRAQPPVGKMMRQDLGKQFPVPEMAEHEHDRTAGTQLAMNLVRSLGRDERGHLVERHGIEFHPAQKVRPKLLEMAPHHLRFFGLGFLAAEGDLQIAARQMPISREQNPGAKAEQTAEGKNETQRERGDQGQRRAVEEVNAKIDHAELGARLG